MIVYGPTTHRYLLQRTQRLHVGYKGSTLHLHYQGSTRSHKGSINTQRRARSGVLKSPLTYPVDTWVVRSIQRRMLYCDVIMCRE